MIQLEELVLENFISHKSTTIDMLDLQGLIMVDGHNIAGKYDSNGAGKSTLLEGIVWNFTGETLRKAGVNGMINRTAGKNTEVKSVMNINGKPTSISRYRAHDTHGDSIQVSHDGQDLTKRLNKETQSVIDDLLGISFRVLTNTIFLGEGLSSKFTQLSDGDKKSLIESTMSLDYNFNTSRDAANKQLKEIQSDLATSKGQITSLESVLADLDRDSLTAKVSDLTTLIQGHEASIAQLSHEYQTDYAKYQDINARKNVLVSSVTNLSHLEVARQTAMQTVANLKQLWANAGQSGECVVCKQATVSAESIHNAQSHYMAELQEQGKVLQGIQLQIDAYDDGAALSAEMSTIDAELTAINAELTKINSETTRLTGELQRMRTEVSNANDLLANADKYENDVKTLRDKVKELESQEEIYKYWYNKFSPTGLLVKVLDEAVEFLNDRIGIYSEMLLDRKYALKLGGGKLTIIDSDKATYETLSNGEKRRLDLAIQFGLHDYVHTYCGLQVDTLFIDEVLDTLDAVGISNIIDILRIKLSYCNLARIFVITHNQDLKSYFDRVLLVSKDKQGYSKLQVI